MGELDEEKVSVEEVANAAACMEVAGLESMVDCDPPSAGYPLNQ